MIPRRAVSLATLIAITAFAWNASASDLPFATDAAVNSAIYTVEFPLAAELLRTGLSREQVALTMELGMAIFTEDYCGVRVMTKGFRMVVDAKAARLGLSKDTMEEAANRLDARLSWHFREDVEDRGVPLTFCRQAREMYANEPVRQRDI